MKLLYFITLTVFYLGGFSQTTLSVKESYYKNESILFYAYSDYITGLKDTIVLIVTDEKGAFSKEISLNTSRQIFVDLGIYRCSFYVEPDRRLYVLKLPPKKEKTEVEKLNIYFEPTEIALSIEDNPNRDLNNLINSFDDIYADFLARNFDTLYHFSKSKIIDKFDKDIQNFYSDIHHPFFKVYRDYKINELRFLGPNRSLETITFKYYNRQPIHYFNPSYMHLFNLMYKDFFNYYAVTKEGEPLFNAVKEGRSIEKIKNLIDKNNAISDANLEELIILKGIHDELFNSRLKNQVHFPKPQMKILLDSIINFSSIPEHRKIALNISKKMNENASIVGKEIPYFKFYTIDGTEKSLDDFKGKYVYLNFMRTDIVPAMESMDRLINFYNNHKKDIEIVSVFTDEDSNNFYRLDSTKYTWNLLYVKGNKQELIDFFHLITWPQFYLISPEGKLIMAPAPSLKEDFEIRFFEKIDSYKHR